MLCIQFTIFQVTLVVAMAVVALVEAGVAVAMGELIL
jgi:hypothetical protein